MFPPRATHYLVPLLLLSSTSAAAQRNDKIAQAMSAAPSSVSAHATILDWPAMEGEDFTTLRQGDNGWTCMPDDPSTEGSDPVCVDDQWMAFMQAWMNHTAPSLQHLGVGYMIAPGGASGSGKDAYAQGRTADNDWGFDPPHMMIIVPNARALQGLPTTRNGGPWVMWAGTPYAHIMIPTQAPPTGR